MVTPGSLTHSQWRQRVIRLRHLFCALAVCAASASPATARQRADSASTKSIVINGRPVRVQVAGLERRTRGSPIVVFEAGATNSLDVWRAVVPQVAAVAPVVAYDRAGLGQSAWDSVAPTPRHVATRLRRMLKEIGAEPPYVLVGSGYAAVIERASPAARAEFTVYRGLTEREVVDRDLAPAPNVPVVMLIAAKPFPSPLQLPFDAQAHFEADLRHRIRMLQEWALGAPKGTVVVTNHTSHAIPREDPDLIVWAVKRVLDAIPRRP